MITVGSCGYDSMHKIIHDRLFPDGYDDYVLLLIKTESFFETDGIIQSMPPNTVMIYSPHTYVHYGLQETHYNDDWIHFRLLEEDTDLLKRLGLPENKPFTLPHLGSLTEYSRLVVQEKLSSHSHRQEVMDSLMHALFYSIADQLYSPPNENAAHKYYYPMSRLRMDIFNAPYKKRAIPELAQQLCLSTSHFQHLYKQFFGTSCIQDIIHSRVRYARLYLCISEMPVSSLALFCGYDNELHFMRQFKKLTGMTPGQYREAHRHQKGERVSLS